eukprot:1159491-Pelagomonas_calceolata.AAC.6
MLASMDADVDTPPASRGNRGMGRAELRLAQVDTCPQGAVEAGLPASALAHTNLKAQGLHAA